MSLAGKTGKPEAATPGSWLPWLPCVITAIWLSVSHANDFHVYWQAGRALRLGGWTAVYQISTLTPFKYHPAFAMAFWPFGLAPESVARVAWALVNAAWVLDVQRRWIRHWGIGPMAIGLGFVCVGHALFWQYMFGNVTFAMLWLWTVALTSPRAWVSSACYATLIALKPFWLALVAPWVLTRRWRLMTRVTLMLALLSAAPLLLGPGSFLTGYQRWMATFADPQHAHNFPKTDNQSWYGLLYRHIDVLDGRLLICWLAGCAAVGLLWFWYWRPSGRSGAAPESAWKIELGLMPFILWTSPLSWIHHQILLWPLLALAWQLGRRDPGSRLTFVASLILLTVLSESIIGRPATLAVLRIGIPLVAFPLLTWWAGSRLSGNLAGELTTPVRR